MIVKRGRFIEESIRIWEGSAKLGRVMWMFSELPGLSYACPLNDWTNKYVAFRFESRLHRQRVEQYCSRIFIKFHLSWFLFHVFLFVYETAKENVLKMLTYVYPFFRDKFSRFHSLMLLGNKLSWWSILLNTS